MAQTRKRPLSDGAEPPPLAVRPGRAQALPQLSTARTVAALIGGTEELKPTPALGHTTVLCKFFARGSCQSGAGCRFSHDVLALAPVPVESKLKTVCKFFEMGQCMRGPACKFAHGPEEMEQLNRRASVPAGSELGPKPPPQLSVPQVDATAALATASGFQNFEEFDAEVAGPTDLEASVPEKKLDLDDAWAFFLPEGSVTSKKRPDLDDAMASFLSEVDGPSVAPQSRADGDHLAQARPSKSSKVVSPTPANSARGEILPPRVVAARWRK